MFDVNLSGTSGNSKKPVFSLPSFPEETLKEASRRLNFFEKVIKVQDGFQAFKTEADYSVWKTLQDKDSIVIDYGEVREMFDEDDELLEEFDDLFSY